MQNNDTTATTTLAQLLTARAEEIAESERENARRAQLSRENDRHEAITYAYNFMRAHFTPELAEALAMVPAVDENQLDEEDPATMPGYLMLDLDGAGVDDGDIARADPDRADRWRLANVHRKYVGWTWMISGPRGYVASIGAPYSTDQNLDRGLLDAIAAYPAWLDRADERRAAHEEQQRAEEERRKCATVRRCLYVLDVLAYGKRIRVHAENPRAEGGMMTYSGSLQGSGEDWLLLNVDDHEPATIGAQRLIPTARVLDIVALPDLPSAAGNDNSDLGDRDGEAE
ncbi:MAG TPA: hypothetical protein VE338_22230 [Ktedonobacterales bacterium]|jgi:hypothetical protein|nr:hypothetical protein [Ktedonobacterales bacterium]